MPLTKSEIFAHVHSIVRLKNLDYFGGYQKCFGHFLREAYAQKLVRSWAV